MDVKVVHEEPTEDPLAMAFDGADEKLDEIVAEDPAEDVEDEGEVAEEQPGQDPEAEADEGAAESDTEEEAEADDEGAEEEPEGEADDEPELIAVPLPEALQEQGLEAFHVTDPAEADALRALTSSYESRAEREAREQDFADESEKLETELQTFRELVAVEPFAVVAQVLSAQGDGYETDAFRHYLLSDPQRWNQHLEWMDSLAEDGAVDRAQRELRLNYRERVDVAKRNAASSRQEREAAAEVTAKLSELLDGIPEADRAFVRKGIMKDVEDASAANAAKGGSGLVTVEAVAKLAAPWITRFGSSEEVSENGAAPEDESAAQPQSKGAEQVRKLVATRKAGRKVVRPSGAPPAKPVGPKKGAPLDEVLKDLKAGKLSVG